MILHDYQCKVCGETTEHLINDSRNIPGDIICPICNGIAVKIVSLSHTSPVDSAWISDVLEVVDKKGNKPHCKEFLRHPTRANYKAWMKGEGLRHLEPGEKGVPKIDKKSRRERRRKLMLDRYMERNRVEIRTA